jgi:hypothetical protein
MKKAYQIDERRAIEKFRCHPALLGKAIDAYLKGFEADWRDAYPGIDAVTSMELCDPPDKRSGQILPVVRYAVECRIASGQQDYWDYATLVELAVLGKDEVRVRDALEGGVRPQSRTVGGGNDRPKPAADQRGSRVACRTRTVDIGGREGLSNTG